MRSKRRRPQFESLEARDVPAALASLTGGVLAVTGTRAADTITVRQSSVQLTVDGVAGTFAAASVASVVVNGLAGNDVIDVRGLTKPVSLDGGAGSDRFLIDPGEAVTLRAYDSTDRLDYSSPDGLANGVRVAGGFVTIRNDGVLSLTGSGGTRTVMSGVSRLLQSYGSTGSPVATVLASGRLQQSFDGLSYSTIGLGGSLTSLAEVRDSAGRQVLLALRWDGVLSRIDINGATYLSGVQTLMQSRNAAGLPVATVLRGGQLQQSFDGLAYSTVDLGGGLTSLAEVRDSAGRQVILALRWDGVLSRIDINGTTFLSGVQALVQSHNGAGLPVATILRGGQLQQSFDGLSYSTIDLGGGLTSLAEVRDSAGRQVILALRGDAVLWRIDINGSTYLTGVQALMQSHNGSGLPVATILLGGQLQQSFDGRIYSPIDLGGSLTALAEVRNGWGWQVILALRSDGVLWRIDTNGSTYLTGVRNLVQSHNGAGLPVAVILRGGQWQQSLDGVTYSAVVNASANYQAATLSGLSADRTAVLSPQAAVYDPTKWAMNGYNLRDISQGASNTCTIGAALASAVAQHYDLGSRIKYDGGGWYEVYLYEFGWVRTYFDGRVDPTDYQPTTRQVTVIDAQGRPSTLTVIDSYWALLFNRAFTTVQAHVDWTKPQPNDSSWYRPLGVEWPGVPWHSPKNAGFALAGGDKNNWDTSEDSALSHLRDNLSLGSICIVSTTDTRYGGQPIPALNWIDRSIGYNHEWAITGLRQDASGTWLVSLYNPFGYGIELSWDDFKAGFDTITMVTRSGVNY
jgi:hypothetical protein